MSLYEEQQPSIKIPEMLGKPQTNRPVSHPEGRYLRKPVKQNSIPYNLRYIPFLGGVLLAALVISRHLPIHSNSYINEDDVAPYESVLDSPAYDLAPTTPVVNLDNDILDALISESVQYPKAKILIAHAGEYPPSLLELAGNRPETLDFVTNYVNYKSNEASNSSTDNDISIAEDYIPGNIPLFLQWDSRWGYDAYGDDFIASSGCGPTCLSMVLVGLLDDTTMNPKTVSDFSYDQGYFTPDGTSWLLMTEGANSLGLYSDTLNLDENRIHSALEDGQPVICSMAPGHFTKKGHFIVLTGLTNDGQITINDPASLINSQQSWDLSLLMSEMKCSWTYTPL